MPNKLSFIAIALLTFCFACKKKDANSGNSQDSIDAYLPLKPGNYWVYESWYVDSNGHGAPGSFNNGPAVYDSIYAIADTVYGSKTYHRFCKPTGIGDTTYRTWLVSDSGDYIVQPSGFVLLALSDTVSTFFSRTYQQPPFSADSFVTVNYKLEGAAQQATPAGTFNTLSMAYIWTFYPFASQVQPAYSRRQHYRFARGIGIVSETADYYVNDPKFVERRLVRYHLQ